MRRYQGHLHRRTGPGIYLSREDSGFKLELRASPPQFKRPTVRQAPAPHQHSMSGTPIRGPKVRAVLARRPIIHCAIAIEPGPEAWACLALFFIFYFVSLLRARRQLPVGSCPPPLPLFPSHLSHHDPFRICRLATPTVSWAGTSQPRNRCEVLLPHRHCTTWR
ncbi:hypothetical protein LY78DRAFT_51425 [Colletotrichum sublineola]|nr:hypothetical protein LY78DRAFT_51425 [Colletotrichum sublineola]